MPLDQRDDRRRDRKTERSQFLLSRGETQKARMLARKILRSVKTVDDLRTDDSQVFAQIVKAHPRREMKRYKGLRLQIAGPLALSTQDFIEMVRNGEMMCQSQLGYRVNEASVPEHTWTIKTVDNKLVGFAMLSREYSMNAGDGWHLDLLCSARGGGLELFSRVLTYYRTSGAAFLELEPNGPTVANSYKWVASKLGIEYTDSVSDGMVTHTMFGRRYTTGEGSITFWLDETSSWAQRLIKNMGYVNHD